MKGCAGFWVGMSAGLLAGAAMGMMSPYGRDPKFPITPVSRR